MMENPVIKQLLDRLVELDARSAEIVQDRVDALRVVRLEQRQIRRALSALGHKAAS